MIPIRSFGESSSIRRYMQKAGSNLSVVAYRLSLVLLGVADGARTHDNRNHNPGLYQLSYSHRRGVIIGRTSCIPAVGWIVSTRLG